MTPSVMYNGVVIDPIVKSVTWSGDVVQPYRKILVSVSNTLDGDTRAISFENGKEIALYHGGIEIFRGVVFDYSIDIRGQTVITAYDENIYLAKNMDDRRFFNVKASDIIRKLCVDFGIATGAIEDTGYVIPKMVLRDKTLWQMMTIALTETRKQTGRRFFIYSNGGLLNVVERKEKVVKRTLEVGVNILDASYSQSIEDLRTSVKVIGGNEESPITVTLKNAELAAMFGTMQHLEYTDGDATRSQVEQLTKQLLADLGTIDDYAEVEALGDVSVTAGSAVYVREPMTGIIGAYYVSTDSHTFEDGVHRMSVTLSATDDLPTMRYDEPPEKKTSGKKPSDSSGSWASFVAALNSIGE